MTAVLSSLLAVVVLAISVNARSLPDSAATAYYEPIVPYGPYPAPGYILSTYVPKYTGYRVVTPVRYPPENDQDQYEDEEPKYYYGGKFTGVCSIDGLYYKDEMTYVVCSNGFASHQPCPPGTKTDKFPSYRAGFYYGSSDLCSVNLVDLGLGPYSYMPQLIAYEHHAPSSHETQPAHGSDEPHRGTYQPPVNSYDPPRDPYSSTYDSSASSSSSYHAAPSFHAAPSYPPQNSYQPSEYTPQNTYVVDQLHGEHTHSSSSSGSHHSYSNTGSYPPQDTHSSPDHPYKPSPSRNRYPPRDTYASPVGDHHYRPPVRPSHYKEETETSYSDEGDH